VIVEVLINIVEIVGF